MTVLRNVFRAVGGIRLDDGRWVGSCRADAMAETTRRQLPPQLLPRHSILNGREVPTAASAAARSVDLAVITPLPTPRAASNLPTLPAHRRQVPIGPKWLHELKHDGFRLLIHRDGDVVRLFTRRGYEWTHRFPRIVDQVRRLKPRMFVIDAEAVFCGDNACQT